ncbi:MAG: class I SAM-dependent methyltransferase [Bacillota bacterium]
MVYTVLDIGAGSLAFAKDFQRLNRETPMLILCGEPQWGLGPFFKPLPPERLTQVLKARRPGIHRITSQYEKLEVADESLDLVTLNAPHPFCVRPTQMLAFELARCLKPGGLFFSSYPRYDLGRVTQDFQLVTHGKWRGIYEATALSEELVPEHPARIFPQSPVIAHNIRVHRHGDPLARGTSYVYFDGISPGYALWQKP